ncbi:FAD-dependent oxidoreductase [Leucobacter sp.]
MTSSLWQLTGSAPRSAPFDPAARVDTVVVGAGLTGLTAAVLLARAGQRVTVLEARRTGAVTTGNTTGKASLLQGTALSELREHAGDEVLRAYAEANREGQAWLLRELEHRGAPGERRHAWTYANSEDHLDVLEREVEASLAAGIPVEWSADTGLPFEAAGAIVLRDQAQLHPMEVLGVLAAELEERGGRIVEHCRVRDVETDREGARVVTELGVLTAETCVLATGTPVLDRGLFFARLEPSRSFVCAYRVPGDVLPTGMYLSVDAPDRSLRTAHGTAGEPLLLVGGGAHVTGRSGDTRSILEELDAWTAERFAGARRAHWWAAQDYRSHSRVPYAGPLPGAGERIYTATGYRKWGMTNAVAAALTIASDLLGGRLDWAATLRDHHLSLFDVRDALSTNISVAGRMVGGWAGVEIGGSVDDADPAEGEGVMAREGLSPVGVSRVDGRLCRVSGACPHLGGVLAWNAAERSWDCPLHGSRFAADGTRLEGPALDDLERR